MRPPFSLSMPWFQPLGRPPKTSGLMISNAMVLLACDGDSLAVGPLAARITQPEDRLRHFFHGYQFLLAGGGEHRRQCSLRVLAGLGDDARDRLFGHLGIDKSGTDGVARHLGALELRRDAPRKANHGVLRGRVGSDVTSARQSSNRRDIHDRSLVAHNRSEE